MFTRFVLEYLKIFLRLTRLMHDRSSREREEFLFCQLAYDFMQERITLVPFLFCTICALNIRIAPHTGGYLIIFLKERIWILNLASEILHFVISENHSFFSGVNRATSHRTVSARKSEPNDGETRCLI